MMAVTKQVYVFFYVIVLLGLWQAVVTILSIPDYVLPAPSDVLWLLAEDLLLFAANASVTASGAVAGFLLAFVLAFVLAFGMVYSRYAEAALWPLMIFTRIIPKFVIVPLLVVWFGVGMGPVVLIVALFAVMPMMHNIIHGLRSVDSASP